MVKKIILLLLFLISLASCDLFLRTPFPEELIYYNDSVSVEGMEPFNSTRLLVLYDYVFLFIEEVNDPDRVYIYTKDLKPVYVDSEAFWGGTFFMREVGGYYYIGSWRYDLEGTVCHGRYDRPAFNPSQTCEPPSGFGFSHDDSNYIVWWDEQGKNLNYFRYSGTWGYSFYEVVPLDMYNRLEALFYHKDTENIDYSGVILIFSTSGSDGVRDIEIAAIPAWYFEDPLSLHIAEPDYFSDYSFVIQDIDPEEYFYSGNGVVIREEEDKYRRFNMAGQCVKEYSAGMERYSDTYTLDGKTRYIFSEKYMKLIKTGVWW